MSNTPTSTFTLHCWGCGKSITKPYEGIFDIEIKLQMASLEGWIKRKFGPGAEVWFCGPSCAYHSIPARQAEEWWEIHNTVTKGITLKTYIHPKLILIGFVVGVAAFFFGFSFLPWLVKLAIG